MGKKLAAGAGCGWLELGTAARYGSIFPATSAMGSQPAVVPVQERQQGSSLNLAHCTPRIKSKN
jgi:hypothetical protein